MTGVGSLRGKFLHERGSKWRYYRWFGLGAGECISDFRLGVVIGPKYFDTINVGFDSASGWVEAFGGGVVAWMENVGVRMSKVTSCAHKRVEFLRFLGLRGSKHQYQLFIPRSGIHADGFCTNKGRVVISSGIG